MPKPPKIPTADEEALQQPAVDPILLLTTMLSGGLAGGLTGGPERQALNKMPGLLASLAERGQPLSKFMGQGKYLTDTLEGILGEAGKRGATFAGGAELGHMAAPNHPLLTNFGAFPMIPEAATDIVAQDAGQELAALFSKNPMLSKLLNKLPATLMLPGLLRKDKKDAK